MEYRQKTPKKHFLSQKKSLPNLVWGVSGQMDCFSSDPDRMVHHGPESVFPQSLGEETNQVNCGGYELGVGASRRRGRDGAETEKKKNLQTEKAMAFQW